MEVIGRILLESAEDDSNLKIIKLEIVRVGWWRRYITRIENLFQQIWKNKIRIFNFWRTDPTWNELPVSFN